MDVFLKRGIQVLWRGILFLKGSNYSGLLLLNTCYVEYRLTL